jgi:hypothetical protein
MLRDDERLNWHDDQRTVCFGITRHIARSTGQAVGWELLVPIRGRVTWTWP